MTRQAAIEQAFRAACADELQAIKPGNVHVHAAGHGMTVADFMRSAEVAAPTLCQAGASLGARVFGAVSATRAAVGQNTNLGIVLLCAPLAMAVEGLAAAARYSEPRKRLQRLLDNAGVEDAEAVFRAIALASPGGLGTTDQQDVRNPATVPLMMAMRAAAQRDLIAKQYATAFADVFGSLAEAYAAARRRYAEAEGWAVTASYLHCLAAWPDSHVARKHGPSVAERLRQEAVLWQRRFWQAPDPLALLDALLDWDATLKARHINPGTSADLTVATIFLRRLRNSLPCGGDDG